MQAKQHLQLLIGTAAIGLAVPLFSHAATFPAHSFADGDDANLSVLRGALRVAATQRLLPDYVWIDVDAIAGTSPLQSRVDAMRDLIPIWEGRNFAVYARSARLTRRDDPLAPAALAGLSPLANNGSRQLLTSGAELQTRTGLRFGADAVFATHSFSSLAMTPMALGQDFVDPVGITSGEQSRGAGLALSVGGQMHERLGWNLGVRSRVDMSAYKQFRGVYSEPGDLDIPASASLGFSAGVLPNTEFMLGAEHVFYSDIGGVSSYSLPNRFLSLLGDSSSPSLAWRDLTVYSAGFQGSAFDWQWSLRYSTALQPSPTAPLLQRAVEGIQSDSNWSVGLGRMFGRFGELRMLASYGGTEYVVGSPFVRHVDPTESTHFEFEAQWKLRF